MRFIQTLIVLVAVGATSTVWSLDLSAFAGESWYGLYMNGDKIGYAVSRVEVHDDNSTTVTQDATFRLAMVGSKQDMSSQTARRYAPDGSLQSIDSVVEDLTGTNRFEARVTDGALVLRSVVGGQETVKRLPPPRESLEDALKANAMIRDGAAAGQTFTFYVFEPMFQQELQAESTVTGFEERTLEGVPTKVYAVDTVLKPLGLASTSYISETGDLLEDRIANGLITMRLEPKAVARDVQYENDTIVSNAALVDAPIADARERATLILRIEGPLGPDHVFDDNGQDFVRDGDGYRFVGKRSSLDGAASATLPITDSEAAAWLEPSTFVQSDHPKLVAQARKIVGGEADALEAVAKLVAWVHDHMRPAFSARLTNALEVLDSMEGDCTEHSVLFVGLARAAGVPAREVAGLIYAELPEPGFYFHQWAKVWVGEWIDVDPTFDQVFADATHVKLSEGDLVEQIKILPVIGQLSIDVVDE